MTNEELDIVDLSRRAKEQWIPPIGAMGGPPAHELYRDLVLHAGLRLLREVNGAPRVELQDGEHRRSFPAPSEELRAALDRFRMRRNLRPVPAGDIDEFARVVEARVSDPDVEIPLYLPKSSSAGPPTPVGPGTVPRGPVRSPAAVGSAIDELDHLIREVDEVQGRAPVTEPLPLPASESTSVDSSPWTRFGHPVPLHSRLPHRWHASVSGARRMFPTPEQGLPKYVRVLRELVHNGTWIGSLGEIARRTGDDTEQVFATLIKFHSDLVGRDLVVAPVEVEEGWQWLVVDRSRMRTAATALPDMS